jgi:hypothetical protein
LIQENYDAAKSDRKMGKRLLPHAMIQLMMTNLIQTQLCSESHWVTDYFLLIIFRGLVLAEGDISSCKHQLID